MKSMLRLLFLPCLLYAVADQEFRTSPGKQQQRTAISRNVVGKKQKTAQANPERYFGIRSMNFNKSIDTLNPRCLVRTVTILDGEPYG